MRDSQAVRITDRFLGTLICDVLTLIRFLNIKKPPAPKTIKPKFLLIELFEMGSAVMLIPSIRFIKNQFPGAEIHILTTSSCLSIWKALESVETKNIHVLQSSSALRFILNSFVTAYNLRKHRFDYIIDFELFMRIPSIFVGVLKGSMKVGFGKYHLEGLRRGKYYTRICSYNQNLHIAKNYLALTKTALQPNNDSPNFKGVITDDEIEITPTWKLKEVSTNTSSNLKPYFAICPDVGNTLPIRNYPKEQMLLVLKKTLEHYSDHHLVFIGTADNSPVSEWLISQLKSQTEQSIHNLCGKTSFDGLLDVLHGASLLFTNDNGPAHFAALTGTKVVAILGAESPYVFGPLGQALTVYSYYQCSPCLMAFNHKITDCIDNQCIKTIQPDQIFKVIKRALEPNPPWRTANLLTSYT